MDEPKSTDYASLPPEAPAAPCWRDAAAPVLALALSLLYWTVFRMEGIARDHGPGLGVPVFVCAYFAAVLIMLGRKARWSAGGACLITAAVVLSACCALYAYRGLTVLNCFIILALSAMATFSLSGQAARRAFDALAVPEAVRLSAAALFTRVGRPFRLMRAVKKEGRAGFGRALLTLAATVIVLAVVLALLASADAVFRSLLPDVRGWFEDLLPAQLLWRVVRTAALALFIASGLYFIREPLPARAGKARPEAERRAAPFLTLALLLDGVYIVFCAVQLRYLFGGAEAAAMAGGWSAYARTGFFQLAAVAAIDLTLCLLGTDARRFASKGGSALRIADGLMLALTAVILLSAARRMQLYILAYGLSVLRLLTLWGMAVIAVGLLAAGWKLYRPGFRFCAVFGGFALGTWCLLCLCSPAGLVANYNVDAYLDGRLADVDVYYLETLSPDALPAVRRLAEACPDDRFTGYVLDSLTQAAQHEGGWTTWKASFLYAG